jgi:hypothetical protein
LTYGIEACSDEKKLRELPIEPTILMWFKKDSQGTKSIRAAFGSYSREALEAHARANAAALVNEGEGCFLNLDGHTGTCFTDDDMYSELSREMAKARGGVPEIDRDMEGLTLKGRSKSRLNAASIQKNRDNERELLAQIESLGNEKHRLLDRLDLVQKDMQQLAQCVGSVRFPVGVLP